MSSDHTADQPTPAGSATPRDVIARTLLDLAGTRALKRGWADTLIESLAAAGYRITGPGDDSEQVLQGFEDAIRAREWALADELRQELLDRLYGPIAAASEPAE